MKTIVKIVLLAIAVTAAIVSVFVFSGTRIIQGVDVSGIQLSDSVYIHDIEDHIASIGHEWRKGFDETDNLISVYYKNGLINNHQEKEVQTLLVDKAACRFTAYALDDYFQLNSWNPNKVSSLKSSAVMLLRHKSASGDVVARGETYNGLTQVKTTCDNYRKAKALSVSYTTLNSAKTSITTAKELLKDTYLRNELSIKSKLENAAKTIEYSHWSQLEAKVQRFQSLSVNSSNFDRARTHVSQIRAMLSDYRNADCYGYHKKSTSDINTLRNNINDIIESWNDKIMEEETYTYDTQEWNGYYWQPVSKTGKRRKYSQEQAIDRLL